MEKKKIDKRFVSTQELGLLLGVTRQTVRNWIKKGSIKSFHIGQNLKIPVPEAVRILESFGLAVPDRLSHEVGASSKNSTKNSLADGGIR